MMRTSLSMEFTSIGFRYLYFILNIVNHLLFKILTLQFEVLCSDRFSHDDVIGEVMVELEGLNLKDSSLNPLHLVREITPRSSKVRADKMFLKIMYSSSAD
jgi:hypothetical protein